MSPPACTRSAFMETLPSISTVPFLNYYHETRVVTHMNGNSPLGIRYMWENHIPHVKIRKFRKTLVLKVSNISRHELAIIIPPKNIILRVFFGCICFFNVLFALYHKNGIMGLNQIFTQGGEVQWLRLC